MKRDYNISKRYIERNDCMLEFMILGMVYDEDLTGYDIKKYIETGIGVFYKASFGSIYPMLKKLNTKGHLTMYEQPQGGRQKKFYQITEEGKNSFNKWLTSPMNVLDGTNAHLAKVYFFDKLPAKVRDQQLQEHEQNNVIYLRKLRELEKQFEDLKNKEDYYYKLSTLYYGILLTHKSIEWCRYIRSGKSLTELIRKEVK